MKILKKHLLIGTGVFAAVVLLAAASIVYGISFTGFFKAFDVSLSPGEYYERNVTVRKFYNVSVRFQKENSTTSLSFDNNESVVVLKDSSGAEILSVTGVDNGRIYETLTNYELASIATVSAYNIGEYADIVDQPVNDTILSTTGTKAYITVKVHYSPSVVTGYVFDDLTGVALGGIGIAAFENDADTSVSDAVEQHVSDVDGRYYMSFDLQSTKSLDVYVDGYDVV